MLSGSIKGRAEQSRGKEGGKEARTQTKTRDFGGPKMREKATNQWGEH
jgi:hypothetical protein